MPIRRQEKSTSHRTPRAVGYLRRSTDRQEHSIPDQKKAIEAYAGEHAMRLQGQVMREQAAFASTPESSTLSDAELLGPFLQGVPIFHVPATTVAV